MSRWRENAGKSSAERGYGPRWRRLRDMVLRDQPLCVACLRRNVVRPTQEIDHIVGKAQGGTDDIENLQGLCSPCHARKTAVEASGRVWDGTQGDPGVDVKGLPLAPGHHWNT